MLLEDLSFSPPTLSHLAKVYSDHCPLLLNVNVGGIVRTKPKFFKLLAAWETQPKLRKFVKDEWDVSKPFHESLELFSGRAK
ncbi:hypothetical protein Scep_004367 [Stephania cephalantha]|uniref:Uncharacterized protein n=1 Tax=Stephania cephalantha TaxID=152367 RepID=A0AAP0PVD0_9MAGN